MDKLIIRGGKPLRGVIRVSGSKNAALPILLAAPLLSSPATFRNVPKLRDIDTTVKLLDILGLSTHFENGVVKVEPARELKFEAPYELVKTMRASALCLGPLLARLCRARVALPGGCAIGARPVNLHLTALEKMGAAFNLEGGYIDGRCKRLTGARIV
ncbi:MAG: UDP-N-acetylglucosamine 1-carboxyvinyltransferase, partial [Desulfovibrionaceae bacterium]|nr:UDP-N-acetylglucosamine 1-carboxyvinyltransferase [Desulfovibrionaceae bacterium]